jgi:hypothetical protein
MTTGNTSLLGLALPVEGELDGTWGDVVNDSITSLVDSAVAGTTTLSADADVTLTDTVLAANQARQAIILWTASNGATTRNITAPARSKAYIVINAGTGSIVLRGAGPTTGVTIVSGERCLAGWNGSDFVKVASSVITALTGTLPIANGGTGATSFASAGIATLTGAETLTNKTIEFVDGTAAAPSITNVGDTNTGIFFPAADVIAFAEGGVEAARFNADGSFYIGATSAAAGQFVVKDNTSGNNIWLIGRSSDGTSSVSFRNNADSAYNARIECLSGAMTFGTGTSATERARISSAGFFGLGTNNPVAMFDLAGDYKEGVVTANTGTAYTISTATGTLQILTLTGNCTFTFPTATTGESFTLFLRQDGTGGRTVTWPANVRWPGGTAPTITSTASRQDKFIFTADGTNFYGSNAGQNYTV